MLPSPDFPSLALQDVLPKDCKRTYQKLNSQTKDTKSLSPAKEMSTHKTDGTHWKRTEDLHKGKCGSNPWDQHGKGKGTAQDTCSEVEWPAFLLPGSKASGGLAGSGNQ